MNREIKFRAWDKDAEQWATPGSLAVNPDFSLGSLFGDIHLMQFTGLKDKNGKDVYEGDIVEKRQGDDTFRYDVRFSAGAFGIEFPPPSYSFKPFESLHIDNYEVIGNIYENPGLLK